MSELITNGTEIKQRIISEINKANQCIYLAMAYFTDRDIAMTIIAAKNRNVVVEIILSSNAYNDTVKLMLRGANINVHAFETGDARGIMHHKFCLIDNKISINGSYNYSINASYNNVENIEISDDNSRYSKYLREFERLKYNIDNNIGVNEIVSAPEAKLQQAQPINIIDVFSQQLQSLVYSAAQIDPVKYRELGHTTSKECKGSVHIFRAEYKNIKERIRTYATDDGLGNKKSVLTSNISISFESTKMNLENEKLEKISLEKRNNSLENQQVRGKLSELKQEKLMLESGDQSSGEKGLLQINKEIEKNKLDKKDLEQSFIIKRFWSVGTVFVILGLVIFLFYLSIFFSSAVYKVFFEGNTIRSSLEAGVNPGLPQLVDANAIVKIFRQEGILFGLLAGLFFLIPILISNVKLLGSKNKVVNTLLFWVGLLVFDIIVSTMVAFNTDEIKSLLVGKEPTLKIWEVVKLGEFWLIFAFGMFPLVIAHYLINYLSNAYNNSTRHIVDAEKYRKIQLLDREMLDLISEKEALNIKNREKDSLIAELNTRIMSLETDMNNRQTEIETSYAELQKKINLIFEDFSARVTSGKIFTDVILDSVVSAFKSGFVGFLAEYYAPEEVAVRVREIEQTTVSAI